MFLRRRYRRMILSSSVLTAKLRRLFLTLLRLTHFRPFFFISGTWASASSRSRLERRLSLREISYCSSRTQESSGAYTEVGSLLGVLGLARGGTRRR